jgi:hypothetical protein
MVKDFEAVGNKLWGRFNASCKEQKWYYEELVKNLEDISNYKMYQEFSDNVEKLFNSSKVIDFINSQEGY